MVFRGATWDLAHLNPFAFRDVANGTAVDVIVFFSCHCFTHKERDDARTVVPTAEIYNDGEETRVLNEDRYLLSRQMLPRLVQALKERHIRVLEGGDSFVTIEAITHGGNAVHYLVLFTLRKDRLRKGRFLLRVKTAYVRDVLTNELKKAGKVRFHVLLDKTARGEKIKG